MKDLGRIEEEDVLDIGNPFNDFLPESLQFDFVDDDDVFFSGACDPDQNQLDEGNLLGELEKFLLSDSDCLVHPNQTPSDADAAADAFLSDIFVDSPPPPPVDVGSGHSSSSDASNDPRSGQFSSCQADDVNQNDDDNDRVGKKRERQLRNKDAAVRSRERKKMYVRDLEIKSRYFEAECKRLGMILQCCHAENQALRFSLQNSGAAFAAPATMQESAVLLLESLLLGSLHWFLGIIGLFILILLLLPILKATPPQEDVGGKSQGSLAPKKDPSKMFGALVYRRLCMMSKRWKGSRIRMKVLYQWLVPSLFMSIDPGVLGFWFSWALAILDFC